MNSPFLHFPSLELESTPQIAKPVNAAADSSPFRTVTKLNGKIMDNDPKSAQFVQIMDELYDEEFEEAIEDLVSEASELYESFLDDGRYFNQEYQARQMVMEHYSPLFHELDTFFDHFANDAQAVDNGTKTLEDFEFSLEQYQPARRDLSELQEFFLKNAIRKIGKVAGKVKNAVKKVASVLPVNLLWQQLKKLVPKLLNWVLEKGLSKLPEQYQPMARSLAQKLMPKAAAAPDKGVAEPEPQSEIDAAFAYFLTTPPGKEWEMLERELDQHDTAVYDQSQALDRGRNEFIHGITQLKEGQSPEPHVEQFVGLITSGLKLGIKMIGRERVVAFITPTLAKLISGLVGKENAEALAKQLVDAGLGLLNLETAEPAVAGAGAVAATVEDTVRQMEHFPGYVFEDRNLLERYVIQAFEKAAAAHLPDVLQEKVYRANPNLRESNRRHLVWAMKKAKKRGQEAFKIKQLNQVIETELTPYIAQEIRTFGGVPLSTFLRDHLGVQVNESLPVRVHLVEALPGSRPYHLGKYAAGVPGSNTSARAGWMQFHPLTSIASGLLLGEPGVGCRGKGNCLGNRRQVGGHRYYYLEIPGARTQYFQMTDGKMVLRRHTGAQVKLNFMTNEIHLALFLSESDAQAIATALRRKQSETAHVLATMAIEDGLKQIFKYGKQESLRIVHPQVVPGRNSGLAIDRVPPLVTNALREAIQNWAGQAMIAFLRDHPDQLIDAVEDYSDGATLLTAVSAPPDFDLLRQMLGSEGYTLEGSLFARQPAEVRMSAKPGYSHV